MIANKSTGQVALHFPKIYQTYSDALAVAGIADLVREIGGGAVPITIKDEGAWFSILSPGRIDIPRGTVLNPGYPYIRLKDDTSPLENVYYIDYDLQQSIVKQKSEQPKKKKKGDSSSNPSPITAPAQEVHPEYNNVRNLSMMRNGWDGDINLHSYIRTHASDIENLARNYLDHFSGPGALDIGKMEENKVLLSVISNSQFFNPITGKGMSSRTPRHTSPKSLPDAFRSGFLEWMKVRGFYRCAISRFDKEQKTITVAAITPNHTTLSQLDLIRTGINKYFKGNIKGEIQTITTIAKTLIEHSEEYIHGDPDLTQKMALFGIKFAGRTPNDIIAGISRAVFVSLGNAYALKKVSFIAIPGWFPITDKDSAQNMMEMLKEHERVILNSLDEEISEDINTMLSYLDFLSAGTVSTMLDFTSKLACTTLHKMDSNPKIARLSTTYLTRFFDTMTTNEGKISDITGNEGFRKIATAIRKATVNAQYQKSMNTQVWDIHYGLAQDWKKHATNKKTFMLKLSEFVQQYNAENAKHAELGKLERREAITTADVDSIVGLIDQFGSSLIAHMLLAYGFAREPTDPNDVKDTKNSTDSKKK